MPDDGKGKLTDLIGAGIWAASAIAVTGYTWDAYKRSYKQFPGVGGGFGNPFQGANNIMAAAAGLPPGKAKPDAAGSYNVTPPGSMSGTNVFDFILNPVLGFLGLGKFGDSKSVPTKNTPYRAWDSAIKKAVQAKDKQRAISLVNWTWQQQSKRGWSKADYVAWMQSRSWGQDYLDLAKSK